MDGSLNSLGTPGMMAGAAVFFEDIDLGLGVGVSGLVFSIMTKLQAIALAFECILSFCSVDLFLDSQTALDTCKSESVLACLDFRNWCWIEHHHIVNVICHKNLDVNWIKVKDHSGVSGNEHANALTRAAVFSNRYLPYMAVMEKSGLILPDGSVPVSVSGLLVVLLAGVVRLLGIVDAFGVSFGFHKFCLFFSVLAGLEFQFSNSDKKKVCVKSVYFYNFLFKKMKKSGAFNVMVDSLAGLLSANILQANGDKHAKSWGSEMDSKNNNISEVLDIENMKNIVTKEMSYIDSNTSETDDMVDNTTPKMMCTRTYVLEKLLKGPFFDVMSNNSAELVFSVSKFVGFKKLLLVDLCVEDVQNFDSKKSFALDVELSAMSDGFGGVSTPSKFPGIIKSFFTSKSSLNKARDLAISEKILVNDEFELSDVASMIAAKWLVLMRKDSVRVALAVDNKQMWILRDHYRALLYTLSIDTTAHDLSKLLASYDGKTCFIGCNLVSYACDRCAVVCFNSKELKNNAIGSLPVFRSVNLRWVGLFLACYAKCDQFGHVSDDCFKQASIAHPVFFGGKTWAQIVSSFSFYVVSLSSLNAEAVLGVKTLYTVSVPFNVSSFNDCLASLECSLELVVDQVSNILKKLSFVDSVPLLSVPYVSPLIASASSVLDLVLDMVLDGVLVLLISLLSGVNVIFSDFSPSSSKVLTTKVCELESKLVALEVSIHLVLVRLDPLGSGLGINVLAKQKNIVQWHLSLDNMVSFVMETKLCSSVKSWIVNKFDGVRIFTYSMEKSYLGASVAVIINNFLACYIFKVEEIPRRVILMQLLFKDKLSITVLGLYAGASAGVRNLASAVVGYVIGSISGFFDTDHKAVTVSIGLSGLLDGYLNSLHKQTNKNHWKFNIKDADGTKWAKFRNCAASKLLLAEDKLSDAEAYGKIDDIQFSRFFGLEILAAKIVKKFNFGNAVGVDCLIKTWSILDKANVYAITNLVLLDNHLVSIFKHLFLVRKSYRKFKIHESRLAEEMSIRKMIEKQIEKFCSDKMVLNHLMVNDKLVMEPTKVKFMPLVLPNLWVCQYAPLDYVRNNTFSGVMHSIGLSKLVLVIGGLPNGKATGLFGILNKLWKHSSDTVVGCLLRLLNMCLNMSVFTNTCSIALIETPRKIFSKVLSNHISFACGKFGVFQNNNFSVLRGTSTQSPVFAVGSVIEDAFEKNKEIWLVLQDMRKAYDSVDWYYLRASLLWIKICDKFIKFFGSIHKDKINKIMTDFGLSNGYRVYDRLDQGEIKKHEQLCEYWIGTKFVSRLEKIENSNRITSHFAAGIFYALNIVSEFFNVNDISINNNKMVTILINQGVKIASLSIRGQLISITKKGKMHYYLGIFLSTESLFKLSVAKAHSDICFFINVVLRKAITNKQFLYLVLAVLQPIINYWTQFSFVLSNVYCKWNAMIRKSLKLKTCLLCDFSDVALHYPLLYGLKIFKQVQSENKLAAVISFSNALGILECLFNHKFLDLQIMSWASMNPLQFFVRLHVSSVNNFLAGVVKVFLCNKLSLVNNLPNVFHSPGVFSMLLVLEDTLYFSSVHSLKCFGIMFGNRLLDKKKHFLNDSGILLPDIAKPSQLHGLNILNSWEFSVVQSSLHEIWSSLFDIFMDSSVKNLGSANVISGTAVYFLAINLSFGVGIWDLLSFTLAKLQAIALALKCVSSFSAIDACVSEMSSVIRGHFGICGNKKADAVAGNAMCSQFSLPVGVQERFLVAENMVVGSVNWEATSRVWHPNLHMLFGFTSQKSSALHSYLMKTKRLYDKSYPSVLCLLCSEIELSDHEEILAEASASWVSLVRASTSFSSAVLWFFGLCSLDIGLYLIVYKKFVIKDWCAEAVRVFDNRKEAVDIVVNYVRHFVELYYFRIWVVRSKHKIDIKRAGLVRNGELVSGLTCCVVQVLSDSVVRMLGIADSFTVRL
ncbi:hypothetical protein G9A89_023765 [Geosiphon pyriformis]|nr:hypothetical protein G9A89_023765 [Geosiphon pyriformis]